MSAPIAQDIAAREERANAAVNVRGIEGTLSGFDVRVTMEAHAREFAACHEPRASRVPGLAGSIEFGIRVLHSGQVSQVDVRASDVGDRALERCFADVIRATEFPTPNGGDANVTWTMMLEPARPGREPELWRTERVERVIVKREPELRESCGLPSRVAYTVTAYVDPRGRVVAAGVAARDGGPDEQLDCIAEGLRSWPMPKAKRRVAKVSFPLGAGAT